MTYLSGKHREDTSLTLIIQRGVAGRETGKRKKNRKQSNRIMVNTIKFGNKKRIKQQKKAKKKRETENQERNKKQN